MHRLTKVVLNIVCNLFDMCILIRLITLIIICQNIYEKVYDGGKDNEYI